MIAPLFPHDLASRAPALLELFGDLIARRVAPPARVWLTEARAGAQGRTLFSEAFTLAARKLGKGPLEPRVEEIGRLASAGLAWPLGSWGLDELGRVTLLLTAAGHVAPDELLGAPRRSRPDPARLHGRSVATHAPQPGQSRVEVLDRDMKDRP